MRKQNVRVVVASEDPETRYIMSELVGREGGVTVGEAQDGPKALALVRNTKPDVAIIDVYLPYVASEHTLPLSRIGGLDFAQTITQEVPNTEIILLNNLDNAIDRTITSGDHMTYSLSTLEGNLPVKIQNLRPQLETYPNKLVFAHLEARAEELKKQKGINPFDWVIFSGACGIALGWALVALWISFIAGGVLILAGLVVVVLGIAAKLTESLWQKLPAKILRQKSKQTRYP